MVKRPVLTHLLLGFCGVLALVNGAEWVYLKYGIDQSRKIVQQPVDSNVVFEQVGTHEFSLAPKDTFSEIVERPLMLQGRRPVSEDEDVPVIAAPVNQGVMQIKLMGIVMTPNGMTAMLQDSAGKYHRVQIDGTVEGWEVDEMHADRVVLKQGASREELKLRKPKPKKPIADLRRQPQRKPAVPALQPQTNQQLQPGSPVSPENTTQNVSK